MAFTLVSQVLYLPQVHDVSSAGVRKIFAMHLIWVDGTSILWQNCSARTLYVRRKVA
jgi:hypothetical protein